MEDCKIFAGKVMNDVILKISGRGTWKDARHFRNIIDNFMEEKWEKIFFNFSECTYLDSTFIGMIAYCLKKVRALSREMILLETQPDVYDTLKTMGVTKFACVLEKKDFEVELTEIVRNGKDINREDAEFILKAHEELEELDESNKDKFQDLKEILKKKIENSNG